MSRYREANVKGTSEYITDLVIMSLGHIIPLSRQNSKGRTSSEQLQKLAKGCQTRSFFLNTDETTSSFNFRQLAFLTWILTDFVRAVSKKWHHLKLLVSYDVYVKNMSSNKWK